MNKPAAKEPSMDEILSSIRQIISDEDEGAPETQGTSEVESASEIESTPEAETMPEAELPKSGESDDGVEDALELSAEQIVSDDDGELAGFDPVEQGETEIKAKDSEEKQEKETEDSSEKTDDLSDLIVADDLSFEIDQPEPAEIAPVETKAATALESSLPDANLADDMADKLLEPATETLVSSAFAQLGGLQFNDKQLTVENMIKQMLRPMLKEWLNENLPSIVEKSVRKEVERLSRGG